MFPERHRRLIRLLFRRGDAAALLHGPPPALAVEAVHDPVLLPVLTTDGGGRGAAMLLRRLALPGAVLLCDDPAVRQTYRAHGATVQPLGSAVPPELCQHVVVHVRDADDPSDVLRAMSRSSGTLAVTFSAAAPPKLLCRVARHLAPYVVGDAPFVNWEPPQRAPAGPATGPAAGLDAVRPRSVTALAKFVVAEATRAAGGKTPTLVEALRHMERRLGCRRAVAAVCVTGGGGARVIPTTGLPEPWPRIAGRAVEMAAWRRRAMAGPPPGVLEFLDAVPCTSAVLLKRWSTDTYHRTVRRRRDEWAALFAEWGHGPLDPAAAALADRLDNKPPPHLVLPPGLTLGSAPHTAVRAALDALQRPTQHTLWVLGAADHATTLGADTGPLLRVLAGGAPDVALLRAADNLDAALPTTMGTILPQAAVLERGAGRPFRGKSDFVGDDWVFELKFSKEHLRGSARWAEWAVQAAIYANHLGKRRALVFNANDGALATLRWD